MFKHFPKLLWTIATIIGLYFLANGFSFSLKPATHTDTNSSSEKSNETKMQAGFDIRNLSHHLLDF